MRVYIHLLQYSFNIRKYKIRNAISLTVGYLILSYLPLNNFLSEEILLSIKTFLIFATAYSLYSNELNLGKTKLNGKENFNTSLLYHYSLLQNPRVLVFANITEVFFESMLLTLSIFAMNISTVNYFKALPLFFFVWFILKSSQFLFQQKRYDYFLSHSQNSKLNKLNIILFIASMVLTIKFLETSDFSFLNYIKYEYLLTSIAIVFFISFILSSINHIENDKTPTIANKHSFLIFNLVFFITSFILSDPFYRIYRQDQFIFHLIFVDNSSEIDRYLTSNPKYINILNSKSSTPLIKALNDHRSTETILAILNHGPDIMAVRKLDKKNSLMLAIENCQLPVINKLLSLGVDINHIDENDSSALFSIHRNDCFEAYPILVKNGINLNAKNKDNYNFISYGLKYNKRFKENFKDLNEIYHFE